MKAFKNESSKYVILFAIILSALTIFSCTKKENTTPPNIILILTDDQGWGDLSFNGNTNIQTPNIDYNTPRKSDHWLS